MKSSSKYCVRDVFAQLSEAEVLGDAETVRRLTALLSSRDSIPAKVLIFHEDTRPGYFGTFTKPSAVVGPRTPFAKDAVAFDYGYDSSEDWEEEGGGDDLMSLDASGDEEQSDVGSELDDWLVDDEEVVAPGTPLSERGGSPTVAPMPASLPGPSSFVKRKSGGGSEKKESKKRKVLPLVPFAKGPCWEDRVGACEYEPFAAYRIQLFNGKIMKFLNDSELSCTDLRYLDTPFPIDPFTFISTPVVEEQPSPSKTKGFVVPPLPTRIVQSSLSETPSQPLISTNQIDVTPGSSTLTTVLNLVPKRKAANVAPPKTPFPDTLLPFLTDKITQLATGNLVWLIESLYQELKVHKVKKNAIEAKVREVGEKCPMKRIWIVKDNVKVRRQLFRHRDPI